MNEHGTVTEDILQAVTTMSEGELNRIRLELHTVEPTFDKWTRTSVKNDINNIRYNGGVGLHTDDAVRYLGGVIIQAKIEGYLIAKYADDSQWAQSYCLEDNIQGDIPYSSPIATFLAGRLPPPYYEKLRESIGRDKTRGRKIAGWKQEALAAYDRASSVDSEEKEIRKFLSDQEQKQKPRQGPQQRAPGDVSVTP
jgi:hypothetical protein